jgi:hypothetical protein
VGVRPLLCRYHGCELEIPLYHTYRFLNRDYSVPDFGCMAFIEVASSARGLLHGEERNFDRMSFEL